jgi:signal transduction histidine kinase
VMVGGIPAWRVADLKQNEKFLQSFGAQIATALEATSQDRGEIDRRIATVREEHLANSRRVAHEVNNPLAIIKNYLGVLDAKLARQEPVVAELSILNEEIDRVGSIIREFSGQPAKPQTGVTDMNQVIQDLVRLFRESKFLPPSVQIIARLPVQACEIDASANMVKQILVNLIKNAVEAMPQGGLIVISHAGQVQREGQSWVELRIKDTGPGMSPEVLAARYAPVRSTKAGENRGLGLSIVHGLIKGAKGQINCQSTKAGTEFEIRLPARPTPTQDNAAARVRATA